MKKRDLIAALAPLDDDTEIMIGDWFGTPRAKIEYRDDRDRDPSIRENQVRLSGYNGSVNRLIPPQILGVDPLPKKEEIKP